MPNGTHVADYLIRIASDTAGAIDAQQRLAQMSAQAQASAAKLHKSYTVVGQDYSRQIKTTEQGSVATHRLSETIKTQTGEVSKQDFVIRKTYDAMGKYQGKITDTTGATTKQTKATAGLTGGYMKLAARAISVIPIWMALRLVYQGVFGSITSLIKTFMDLSKEMGRVAGVTRGQEEALKLLRNAVIDYSATASRGFKEAASAIYALGSAGLTVTEQLTGLEGIMNVAIGTFGDVEQIAKLVAGSYNVFGKSLEGAYTSAEKFQRISDILAFTYSTQQVELSEISNAMTYVASVAGLLDIEFEELVTTIGVLNTGMLKGSKSGTALMNAFVRLAQKGEALGKLGVIFDPAQPLDFLDVITQLHKKYGDTALSVTSLGEIMQVFGRRGGRAAAQLIHDFDRWQRSMDDTRNNFEDFAEYMREQAEDTLPGAWAKLGNAIKANILGGIEEGGVKGILSSLAEVLERSRIVGEMIKGGFVDKPPTLKIPYLPSLIGEASQKAILDLREAMGDLYPIVAKVSAEVEEQTKGIEKSADASEKLKEIHAKYRDTIKEGGDLQEAENKRWNDILCLVQDMVGLRRTDWKLVVGITRELLEQYDITEALAEVNRKLTDEQVDRLKDIDKAHRYELMRIRGYEEAVVLQTEVSDILDEINDKIRERNKHEKEKEKTEEDYVALVFEELTLDDIRLNNMEKLHLIGSSVLGTLKDIYKAKKKILDVTEELIKTTTEYANQLKSAFTNVFADVLRGETGLTDMFDQLAERWRDIQIEAFSTGLTETMFKITDLGGLFGMSTTKLRYAFEKTGNVLIDSLAQGGIKAGATIEDSMVRAGTRVASILGGTTRVGGGGYGDAGGYGGIGGLPGMGFLTTPFGGAPGVHQRYQNYMQTGKRPLNVTPGQIIGLGFSTAMATEAYGGMGTAAGVMGGAGALFTGMAGLGMGAALGPIGAVLSLGAMLLGMFQTPPKWRREETKESTRQIASRIDISNRELQWVNRNLVALRQELVYIMQESYYFRERSEEERFAIGSARGIT